MEEQRGAANCMHVKAAGGQVSLAGEVWLAKHAFLCYNSKLKKGPKSPERWSSFRDMKNQSATIHMQQIRMKNREEKEKSQ